MHAEPRTDDPSFFLHPFGLAETPKLRQRQGGARADRADGTDNGHGADQHGHVDYRHGDDGLERTGRLGRGRGGERPLFHRLLFHGWNPVRLGRPDGARPGRAPRRRSSAGPAPRVFRGGDLDRPGLHLGLERDRAASHVRRRGNRHRARQRLSPDDGVGHCADDVRCGLAQRVCRPGTAQDFLDRDFVGVAGERSGKCGLYVRGWSHTRAWVSPGPDWRRRSSPRGLP